MDAESELSIAPSDLDSYVENQTNLYSRLSKYQQKTPDDDTAHVLRIFFKFLPQDGQNNLTDDALACQSDEELNNLALSLVTGLLLPIKAVGQTPEITPSPHFGFRDSIENLTSEITDPVKRKQHELRRECLKRDGNICVISKAYNLSLPQPNPSTLTGPIQAAHILPFSLSSFLNEKEHIAASMIWTNLYRCFPSLQSRLNFGVDNINNLENVMMLLTPLHHNFRAFKLALELTNEPNTFRVKTYRGFSTVFQYLLPNSGVITFTNYDHQYPLPSKGLLEIHAAIANILHATGKGEVADEIMREKEETYFLKTDGSTDIGRLLSTSHLALYMPSNRQSPRDSDIKTQATNIDQKQQSSRGAAVGGLFSEVPLLKFDATDDLESISDTISQIESHLKHILLAKFPTCSCPSEVSVEEIESELIHQGIS